MAHSVYVADLWEAVVGLEKAVGVVSAETEKWEKGAATLKDVAEQAADGVKELKRGRGRDRRPRERRTDPHPEVQLTLRPNGAYRIRVKKGALLEPDAHVLQEAAAKARDLLHKAPKPLIRMVVGRAISHIANAVMRSYVGSSLPTNSQFEYETTFTKSKVLPPRKQLAKCPVPFRNAMDRALKHKEVKAALGDLDDKEQCEAVHQAITNGYKSFTTHKSRRLKKEKEDRKEKEKQAQKRKQKE